MANPLATFFLFVFCIRINQLLALDIIFTFSHTQSIKKRFLIIQLKKEKSLEKEKSEGENRLSLFLRKEREKF